MKQLSIGDVTITSIIERDGPWRKPEEMFPAYDPDIGRRHLAALDPEVFDPVSGSMVITYQTYVVRTPKHTILIDTCTGEDKGYPPPMDFPKQPWLDGFHAAGLRFDDIDYVFCTHLHIDHTGWNTMLRNGRWVPTFPKAKYIFHKGEYAAWEEEAKRGGNRPGGGGNVWPFNCEPVVAAGQALLVDDDYQLDDTLWLTPTPGPFAVPLLRQYPLARAAGDRRRRSDASRAAVPRAGLVDGVRLGSQAGRAVAKKILKRHRGHRPVRAADPFSASDHRVDRGRRRAVSLQVRALKRELILVASPLFGGLRHVVSRRLDAAARTAFRSRGASAIVLAMDGQV